VHPCLPRRVRLTRPGIHWQRRCAASAVRDAAEPITPSACQSRSSRHAVAPEPDLPTAAEGGRTPNWLDLLGPGRPPAPPTRARSAGDRGPRAHPGERRVLRSRRPRPRRGPCASPSEAERRGGGAPLPFEGRVVEVFADGGPSRRFHLAQLGTIEAVDADGHRREALRRHAEVRPRARVTYDAARGWPRTRNSVRLKLLASRASARWWVAGSGRNLSAGPVQNILRRLGRIEKSRTGCGVPKLGPA
jgi:hypothetical protein